jgi:hypothetical protein
LTRETLSSAPGLVRRGAFRHDEFELRGRAGCRLTAN